MEKPAAIPLSEQVQQQLQRILQQDEFKRSSVLSKFLDFIVQTKLASKEDEIKEYTIGVKALGRSVDFNPQLDAVVRIHASRLRVMLSQYYQDAGKDDPVKISIPKGTYVPLFEMKRENTLANHISVTPKIFPEKPALSQKTYFIKPVLAVLPFHDLSQEPLHESFLTALGEQLSSELSRFDNLSVISFYATRSMSASVMHLKDLKSEGIDYILTGSLRRWNGIIRFNIQLMMVDSGNILWSDSLLTQPSPQVNTLDIQDEIILQIANAIADDPRMVSTLNRSRQWDPVPEKNLLQDAISQYFDYTYDYNSKKFEATLKVMETAYETAPQNAFIVAILAKLYLDQFACAVEQDENL
ncbi:MAG TPA: hypothetical protein VFL47_03630, partial [Flavisolibacter sp.]|nr:hypothetical protein [Flavisolibacter sp.]